MESVGALALAVVSRQVLVGIIADVQGQLRGAGGGVLPSELLELVSAIPARIFRTIVNNPVGLYDDRINGFVIIVVVEEGIASFAILISDGLGDGHLTRRLAGVFGCVVLDLAGVGVCADTFAGLQLVCGCGGSKREEEGRGSNDGGSGELHCDFLVGCRFV